MIGSQRALAVGVFTVFLTSIIISDVLLYTWHFLYKKVEKLGEDDKDEK